MPEFILGLGDEESAFRWSKLSAFTQGYIEAAFFCGVETGDDCDKSEEYGFGDLDRDSLIAIVRDCREFEKANESDLEAIDGAQWDGSSRYGDYDREAAGRDYWFTRNGHGVGFWSRGFEGDAAAVAERLDHAASQAGESDLYLGDDDRVHVSPTHGVAA